jgi:hypothetical protein
VRGSSLEYDPVKEPSSIVRPVAIGHFGLVRCDRGVWPGEMTNTATFSDDEIRASMNQRGYSASDVAWVLRWRDDSGKTGRAARAFVNERFPGHRTSRVILSSGHSGRSTSGHKGVPAKRKEEA